MMDRIAIDKIKPDDSTINFQKAIGKEIVELSLDEDKDILDFKFSDNSWMSIHDSGQSCCERRYMRTDDNLKDFIGGILIDGELRNGPEGVSNYDDCHDVQFLVIKTSKGQFVMSSHNEHNGYYGGFDLSILIGK